MALPLIVVPGLVPRAFLDSPERADEAAKGAAVIANNPADSIHNETSPAST
jgi:hypothetical protein